jgi:hypothetical protein
MRVAQNVGPKYLNMLSSRRDSGKLKVNHAILSTAQADVAPLRVTLEGFRLDRSPTFSNPKND